METRNDQYRILVVEDEPVQAMKLAAILSERGYTVDTAADGLEALEAMERTPPDLVLTDVVMPLIDGYELCRRIRRHETLRDTLVVLLTCLGEPLDVIKGLAVGADNFVNKPYDSEELLQNLALLLKSQGRRSKREMRDGAEISFQGERFVVRSTQRQVLNFFLSVYQEAAKKHEELKKAHHELQYFMENLTKIVDDRTAELREEVAERKRLEEGSRERAALLDKAQEAIVVLEPDGTIQHWNKSAQRLYGWDISEVEGKTLECLVHNESHPMSPEPMNMINEKGEWTGELTQVTKEGREVVVQSSWTLVRDEEMKPKRILSINTDITQKKSLDAQFLRTQRLESIGVLAGGVAHDLNNLIVPIILGMGLLRRRITDAYSLQMLGVIESSAKRAGGVVQQVLAFARSSGEERVVTHAKHLLNEVEAIVRESFPKTIECTVDCPKDLLLVSVDLTKIHQVVMNLCVNAKDAMPDGGRLLLKAENVFFDEQYVAMNSNAKPGPYILLRVRDTGSGIPAEIREKIFDPFFSTKGPGKGTGLGLSTVLSIVQEHGGFVRVESDPDSGSEFQVYLPAVANVEETSGSSNEEALPLGNGEEVIFVDDEELVRRISKVTLEEHGYKVHLASDGAEALGIYAANKGRIAAVVLDLVMPFLEGPATAKALLRLDPGAKIIAITGHDEEARKMRAMFSGQIPLLPKPFTVDKLLTLLYRVIHDAPASGAEVAAA